VRKRNASDVFVRFSAWLVLHVWRVANGNAGKRACSSDSTAGTGLGLVRTSFPLILLSTKQSPEWLVLLRWQKHDAEITSSCERLTTACFLGMRSGG
jgi:hypothetical protein